jgi:hypothetical protein
MTETKKCSRCGSTVELKYFELNRKGEPFKTCDRCRANKSKPVNFMNCDDDAVYDAIIDEFTSKGGYPTHWLVTKAIENAKHMSLDMLAEYGEYNHEQMKAIWDNITNEDIIKQSGRNINQRGGMTAMQMNFYTFLEVLRLTLAVSDKDNNVDKEAKHIIWTVMKGKISSAWNGVGGWMN